MSSVRKRPVDLPSLRTPRLQILVTGVVDQSLVGQTLRNSCAPTRDTGSGCLGRLEARGAYLLPNVIERLTWVLLCWPQIDELLLEDENAGGLIARVRRVGTTSSQVAVRAYRWRDMWVEGDAGLLDMPDNGNGVADFPPGRESRVGGMLSPNEAAVASRERIKLVIQRCAGRGVARLAHRCYQWLGEHLRQVSQAAPCPADAATEALAGGSDAPHTADAVLLMVPRLAPGGAEKNIMELAVRLAAFGRRVHMMTTFGSRNAWAGAVRDAGIELLHLPDFLPANCWLSYLAAFVRSRGIGLLHVMNSHWTYQALPHIRAACPGLRVVTQLHAEGEPGVMDYPTMAAQQDAWVDCHTVISEHLARHMKTLLGANHANIDVIRTGIDVDAEGAIPTAGTSTWRLRTGVPAQVPVVVFVGRFSELKRPLLFVDIAERVLRHWPDALFVMKGEGPLERQVRQRLAGNPLLAGKVRVEDATGPVAELMAAADMLVLPSRMEGIAYVSYEAMAHGLPQVYADVGGQSELLDEATGVAVALGGDEIGKYADAILGLLRQPDRRRSMGEAARVRIRDWPSADDSAAAYHRLYTRLLGG